MSTDSPSPAPTPPASLAPAPGPATVEPPAATGPSQWSPPRHPLRNTLIFFTLIVAGVAMALYAWDVPPFSTYSQSTSNAFVKGHTTVVSPQVSGYITEVLVTDYDTVKAGQPLVKIDDRTFRQRVQQAEAQVAAQRAQLANSVQSERSAQASVKAQEAALVSARSQLVRAEADLRRADTLVRDGSISERERDQTVATARSSVASVQQVEAQRNAALEQVRSVVVNRGALEAAVRGALAQLQQAEIDLSHTVVMAPSDGRLGQIGGQLGQYVSAGTQLMSVVPPKVWVIANFKEKQIAQMRVGQTATFRVDALNHAELKGRVEEISPAAGSEFSVVTPDNATGNFVKVAQRISVRIGVDPDQPLAKRLAPGMSVEAVVHTDSGGKPLGQEQP